MDIDRAFPWREWSSRRPGTLKSWAWFRNRVELCAW